LRHTVAQSDKRYSLSDFTKTGVLGEGGFSVVYVVELKENIEKRIKK
jgi:hypothetical protein